MPRTADERLLPRMQKLSPLCTTSLLFVSPGLPVLRGVSGGGAALSSLCRRFPGGDIMNLTSRRSPLSGLSFSLFFFLRERKRGLRRRRSREISVGEAKCYICRHKRAGALHLIRRLRRHLPLGGEGKGEIVPRGSTNEGNFGVRQSVNRFDIMLSMVWKAHCFFIRFSISLFVAPISSSAYSPDTASARIL